MTTFFLTVIILALIAYIAWSDHQHRDERRHNVHLTVAKNPAEVKALDDRRDLWPVVADPDPPRQPVLPDGYEGPEGI